MYTQSSGPIELGGFEPEQIRRYWYLLRSSQSQLTAGVEVIPVLRILRQESLEFKAVLGSIVRTHSNK